LRCSWVIAAASFGRFQHEDITNYDFFVADNHNFYAAKFSERQTIFKFHAFCKARAVPDSRRHPSARQFPLLWANDMGTEAPPPCLPSKTRLTPPHAPGLRESVDNREAGGNPALFPQL
jgi:hypothetical protein